MNTHDKYELPTLPEPFTYTRPGKSEGALFHAGHMQDYARAAIEADRKTTTKQLAAYESLVASLEAKCTHMRKMYDELKVRTNTDLLASERAANAILTAELEATRKLGGDDQQPFGYFRPEPFGWTDCAATDDGAIALYERPPAQGEPVACFKCGHAKHGGECVNVAPQPAEPEHSGWYCAHCQRGVDSSEVTFHEQHLECGRVITDDSPPQPAEPVKLQSDDERSAQGLPPYNPRLPTDEEMKRLTENGRKAWGKDNTEPVRVPSDDDLLALIREHAFRQYEFDDLLAFARALLNKYGAK